MEFKKINLGKDCGIKKKYKDYVQLALLIALYYITLSKV